MDCCTNLSVTVGTPRFLTTPSGFGISTHRTGWGLYFLVLNCSLMFSPFLTRCSLSSVYFIPSTPSAPLFRTTCRYALLRLSLDSICSIRLLVSMRSFLSVSLDLTTFIPIGYGRCLPPLQHETHSNLLIVCPFTPSPLRKLLRYYGLGWLLTVRCY